MHIITPYPMRFGVNVFAMGSIDIFNEQARHVEGVRFDSMLLSDHLHAQPLLVREL
jgi:hypothetical protein